jgi:RHS repeat-associated protein
MVENYYAFGQPLPKWNSKTTDAPFYDPTKYRYGFNGKEDDDEWSKQDYGFRIYDGRIGRFLSVDPLTKDFPWYTPYQYAGNSPIYAIDLDGLEPVPSNAAFKTGKYGYAIIVKAHPSDREIIIQQLKAMNIDLGLTIIKKDPTGQNMYFTETQSFGNSNYPGSVVTNTYADGEHRIPENPVDPLPTLSANPIPSIGREIKIPELHIMVNVPTPIIGKHHRLISPAKEKTGLPDKPTEPKRENVTVSLHYLISPKNGSIVAAAASFNSEVNAVLNLLANNPKSTIEIKILGYPAFFVGSGATWNSLILNGDGSTLNNAYNNQVNYLQGVFGGRGGLGRISFSRSDVPAQTATTISTTLVTPQN